MTIQHMKTTPEQAAPPAATPARLSIEGVSKSFGPVAALSGVSFSVASGEVHGLIGENGAGKSTLMAIASGALAPDAGVVRIGGVAISADPSRVRAAGLAIVRQHPALLDELSVADNLYLGVPADYRPRGRDLYAWARETVRIWDGTPRVDVRSRLSSLTPEQRFIVEICKVLRQEPRVLLLDEPSEHLGAEDVERLFILVRRLAEQGTAVVYISHRIAEVQAISDTLTVLRDGVVTGTHRTAELDADEIVRLIVGRSLEATFPAATAPPRIETVLEAVSLTGHGFAGVDLSVRAGEIVGIAGIDGNGQAGLLRALAGLDRSSGRILLDGSDARLRGPLASDRDRIAFIPADRHRDGIFGDLGVRENLVSRSLGSLSRIGFVSGQQESAAATGMVDRLRIKTSSLETPVGDLSGGNQQKVVIGSAMLTSPRVLLAEQPTQGVDVGAKIEIYSTLREIAASGSGVVAVSSSNAELAGLCDRVLVMSRGSIVAELSGERLTEAAITDAVLRASVVRSSEARPRGILERIVDSDRSPLAVVIALIIALGTVAQLSSGFYISERNIGGVLALASVLIIVSLGQSMVIISGGIDLSVGPLMGLVTVIGSYYLVDGLPPGWAVIAWVAIAVVSVGVGVLNWTLVTVLRIHPMLATLATYMLLQAIGLLLRPTPGGLISSSITSAITERVWIFPVGFIAAVVLAFLIERWVGRARSGKALRAAGTSLDVARLVGSRPERSTLLAYVGCSLLAGLAGIALLGMVGTGDASSGTIYTLQSVAAAVVGGISIFGGRGSFVAVLGAAVLLTQVRSVTTFLSLNDAWQNILLSVIMFGAVVVYSLARRRLVADR